jgi:hypothetical protein
VSGINRKRFSPVAPTQRLGRPLDAICGARAAEWDDEVCVLPIGHDGVHVDYCGGAWGHDVRRDTSRSKGTPNV